MYILLQQFTDMKNTWYNHQPHKRWQLLLQCFPSFVNQDTLAKMHSTGSRPYLH